jgi:hypothetical protein
MPNDVGAAVQEGRENQLGRIQVLLTSGATIVVKTEKDADTYNDFAK